MAVLECRLISRDSIAPPRIEETETPFLSAQRRALKIQAEEIARDLALMDEIEALAQSMPKRTEGRNPTTREIREIAYEEREANLL